MAVPYVKLDINQKHRCKNLLFDQEIAGSKVYYHSLEKKDSFVAVENGETLRIFFQIEGEAVYNSQGQEYVLKERVVFTPHPNQGVLIVAKERTCILEIQWELLEADKRFMEKAKTKYPYVQIYSQCEEYYEDNGGNDVTQRSIIDHHAMPRFAMGSNEAKGPDQMAEQSHPLVDQMFFSFPENKVELIIDDERIVMEGNTLLHVPLGARHAVEIPKDGLMHYIWIDFLIDPGAMAFLDAEHQKNRILEVVVMKSEEKMLMWEKYLCTCPEKDRIKYEDTIRTCGPNPDWALLQKAFLDSTDTYLDVEIGKPVEVKIKNHEAGGQFRIAFPHLMIRSREDVKEYMKALMEARRNYVTEQKYHGYVDCDEIHHDVESFIYFQNPLLYYQFPGHETALTSILDFAEHTGNWAEGVPDWYDWEKHGFTSTHIGTKEVKNYPPYDYQEANHFRFIGEAVVAYQFTKEQKYLDLICDYCDRWCDHIEASPEHGPIACQIMPGGGRVKEMGHAAQFEAEENTYHIFYSILQVYVMIDLVNGLLDAYLITGKERYVTAVEKCLDQCFYNGNGIRPAVGYANGEWILSGSENNNKWRPVYKGVELMPSCSEEFYLTKMLMRYTRVTGSLRYKEGILRWAADINENENQYDQMRSNLLVLAHYLDGDEKWLNRAYDMALRHLAVVEHEDMFHQCEQNVRQGSKVAMELLYTVMLGDSTFATRGEMPDQMFRYETDGTPGLSDNVALRIWYKGKKEYSFEAKNLSSKEVVVRVYMADGRNVQVITADADKKDSVEISGNSSVTGYFCVE